VCKHPRDYSRVSCAPEPETAPLQLALAPEPALPMFVILKQKKKNKKVSLYDTLRKCAMIFFLVNYSRYL